MVEPTIALDPISTQSIEDLLTDLKNHVTIAIVTHNMQQAGRVSDFTGYFLNGDLVEFGPTNLLFTTPKDKRTEAYITGRFVRRSSRECPTKPRSIGKKAVGSG
jgi:phosphate transport system ATP-binding protein